MNESSLRRARERRVVVKVLDEHWPASDDASARQYAMEDCADRLLDDAVRVEG